MKIAVCVKQVPLADEARIDPETKRIVREGAKALTNPFDLYAIEAAVRLREELGGEVVALSMGPEKAKACLREALSLGADRAIHLCDRAFAGSDTWATSYVLSKAVEKIGGVDLVLCGRQALDGDTAQVGPGIAAHLGWAQAACALRIESASCREMTVARMRSDGYDVVRFALPAVVTVLKDANVPRVPTLRGVLAARKAEITVWGPADIGCEPGRIGLFGSPTRVVKAVPPEGRGRGTLTMEGTPAENARALLSLLSGLGVQTGGQTA